MGRRPDTPAMQEAKGHTGKRGTRAERERAAKMERLIGMLTPLAGVKEVAPPSYLKEPGYEIALAVWMRKAPELSRTHRLPKETHDEFAVYCVYYAEWLELDMDIKDRGRSQKIKNVSGSLREVDRPSIRHRQTAFQNMKDMWPKFGLTAVDIYSIFKDQAAAAANNPGLFDGVRDAKPAEKAEPESVPVDAPSGPLGSAARYRSEPPKLN